MKNNIKDLLIPVLAVLIALLIGAGIIFYLGQSPLEAYGYLFQGAFFGKREFAKTLTEATPMIFTGLSLLVGFKAGLFNIGAQGQVIAGGLAAVTIGAFVHNVIINNIFVVIIAAALAGFLFSAFAGYLKAKLGIHEVITTIMLNYIAGAFEQYCLNYPLKAGGVNGPSPQTPPVSELARLPLLMESTKTALNWGFILAIVAAIVIWFIFQKTVLGYEIKAVGHNMTSSENAGVNVKWILILTMGISGLLAGLGGAYLSIGALNQFTKEMSAGRGFMALAALVFGKWKPKGVIFASLLFGFADALQVIIQQYVKSIPPQFIQMIPYILTILALAGVVGKAVAPKASGVPYDKGN